MLATLAGLLAVLSLGLLSPGPDFLLVVRNSIGGHRARGLATVAGISLGLGVQTAAIALGLAAVPASVFTALQLTGAAYLAWLGLRALLPRRTDASDNPGSAQPPTARSGFVDGLACNLTNPKAFLFFTGVFAQLVPPGTTSGWRIGLPLAITLHGAILWTLVVTALQSPPVAKRLEHLQHWLPKAFGAVLLVFAVWLTLLAFSA